MSRIILFETEDCHKQLLPLSFTRPVCDFRAGIETVRSKWKALLPGDYDVLPVEYLRERFTVRMPEAGEECLFIAGNLLPDEALAAKVASISAGTALMGGEQTVAFRGTLSDLRSEAFAVTEEISDCDIIKYVFDIFLLNGKQLLSDYRRLTAGRTSQPLPLSNTLIGPYEDADGMPLIFIEEGADVQGAMLNTTGGPIYIGENATVMEGSCLRGPLSVGFNSKVRMGARIYGETTIGPWCKVGGEVDNSVIFGYSNKAHDGYLGNAVVGEWCNIGAGVNASNLKNDYSKIRVWNYASRTFMRTDLQFCGLIMGDHSKAGINSMFNTASVVGVGCNIHGSGFPRVFIPSFSEGSPQGGFSDVSLKKFYDIAERVMSRRGIALTESDRRIYERVYDVASTLKR